MSIGSPAAAPAGANPPLCDGNGRKMHDDGSVDQIATPHEFVDSGQDGRPLKLKDGALQGRVLGPARVTADGRNRSVTAFRE
jgi:hypothetical protein